MKNRTKQLNWMVGSGIVGADIGTSIFYGTGILFPIVGYLSPLFILSTCLLMWLLKKAYLEGMALSPYNGGAYSMVLRTKGRRWAVFVGALTCISYLATASVSALSGGFYLSSLLNINSTELVVLLSFIPIVFFAVLNSRGIEEPAKLVTAFCIFHFSLLLILCLWGLSFIITHFHEIDFTKFKNIHPTKELSFSLLIYGFAASFLGITGFESVAQIIEELKKPALETVKKIYQTVILIVSFTAPLISLICLVILTPEEVDLSLNFLLSKLCEKLGGRLLVSLIVIDATITLFCAVNTAFVGFIGLSKTMSKQGNLPKSLLKQINEKYPSMKGYPYICFFFALVAMLMSSWVAGQIDVAAKVYELAFLSVMVSFCIGVIFMKNQPRRKNLDVRYLSKKEFQVSGFRIPVTPLICFLILSFSSVVLFLYSKPEVKVMLLSLCFLTVFMMAYYRWGFLEKRLEVLTDLRLGLGQFSKAETNLPKDLPKFIICCGMKEAKKLIRLCLRYICKHYEESFELIIFHAEEDRDPHGFFFESLQRIVSQQIAPNFKNTNCVLTVKIVPGDFFEGLQTLRKQYNFNTIIVGESVHPEEQEKLEKLISDDLRINILHLKQLEEEDV